MILNFKEIPQANKGNGLQDEFELFARDFLEFLGYKIINSPDRGADGKKDLIVEEIRKGLSGESRIRWLVSCKHYAHSGKSISDSDEPNILDRVHVHKCAGFIGFYSTLPATSLTTNLEGLRDKIPSQTFDRGSIEKLLLDSAEGLKLASRFFPNSLDEHRKENPQPKNILDAEPEISCEYCGKDIIIDSELGPGIFVMLREINRDENNEFQIGNFVDGYLSCKGRCDQILKEYYMKKGEYSDSWIDVSKFKSPVSYIKNMIDLLNFMSSNNKMELEKACLKKFKTLLIQTFPYVARESTSKEKKEIEKMIRYGFANFI